MKSLRILKLIIMKTLKKIKTKKPAKVYVYHVGIYNKETGEKLGWHSAWDSRREAYKHMYSDREYSGDCIVERFTEDVPATLGFFGKIRKLFTGVHPTTPVEMVINTPIEYRVACWTVDANYAAFLMRTHLCGKQKNPTYAHKDMLAQEQFDQEIADLPF
jgi:hypothetical protein